MNNRTAARIAGRYSKCRVLASRGATAGERAAGLAAAFRMWNRYDSLRTNNPFAGILGFSDEILDVLLGLWNNRTNRFVAGTDTLELRWFLAMHDHKELRRALRTLRARRDAGFVSGQYHGPKINSIESDLKMLNVLEWPLEMALRASEIAEFGEAIGA